MSKIPAEEPEARAVEEANLSFYRAFETLAMPQMEAVWGHGDAVHCVHPGWGLITGRADVMSSWARIFENTSLMNFRITDAQVHVAGDFAWVICVENITSVVDTNVSEFRVLTTNMFRKQDDRWLMVHHHGSPLYGG